MPWRSVPVLVFAALAFALPAQAAPLEREHYSGSDSFDIDCGIVIHDELTFEGVFMLKAPRADGAPPYYFDNYEVHEVLTANGRTAYLDHQGLYKDLKIRHVAGTVYEFTAMEAGRPWVLSDEDGKVLVRDRGLLRVQFQVDTRGDTDLDNDVFLEGSWSLLKDAGRHPAFYFDFCEVMNDYFTS